MDNSKKALTATLSLTLLLFSFIIFLLYIIYCYAYYDKYLEQVYTENINNSKYEFVYEKMVGKGNLTYGQFKTSIDNLTNKDKLKDIFNTYYKDSNLFTIDTFLDTYYFKDINVNIKDIKFTHNGKTNLFTRRAIFYDEVTISNDKLSTKLGVFNKINFKIEKNAILRVDNKDIECIEEVCTIDKMYGGIYEISYISNGYEYYGLVNINKDKQSISVTNLDSLVKVKELDIEVKYGKYSLNICNGECPSTIKSYLILNEDGTYYSYRYYETSGNASIDTGTYSVEGNKIILVFKNKKETYLITGSNLLDSNNILTYSYNN